MTVSVFHPIGSRILLGLLSLSLASAQTRRIAVIAHRGEHLHHPENTLPAYQAAWEAGADYVEVDVRTAADGTLVLMHDETVNRRTNGTGNIREMTLAQVRELDAGIKSGPRFAGTPVPTFDEGLAWARGRIGVYVDAKSVSAASLVAALEKHGMLDHAVIYGGLPLLQDIAALRPRARVMPEARSAAVLRALLDTLHPKVIAFDARDFTSETLAVARQAGAEIFVDRLGAADNPASWQDAVDRGATGIQTDRPAELVQYLRAKGLHK